MRTDSFIVRAQSVIRADGPPAAQARALPLEAFPEIDRSGRSTIALGATTGFHANETRLPGGKVLQELLALELQTHDFSGLNVDPVQLKHPLGNINADYRFAIIHLGPSGLPVKIFVSSTLGTFDAVGP